MLANSAKTCKKHTMKQCAFNWVSLILLCISLSSCGVFTSKDYVGYKKAPYTVKDQRYFPMTVEQALNFEETGTASWYDESTFFGLKRGITAIGEKVAPWDLSAAHKTLPLPCRVKVTNLSNGKSVKLRVNDRGPYIGDRIIDLTPRAARKIGFEEEGLTEVKMEVLSVGDGPYKVKKKKRFFFF